MGTPGGWMGLTSVCAFGGVNGVKPFDAASPAGDATGPGVARRVINVCKREKIGAKNPLRSRTEMSKVIVTEMMNQASRVTIPPPVPSNFHKLRWKKLPRCPPPQPASAL